MSIDIDVEELGEMLPAFLIGLVLVLFVFAGMGYYINSRLKKEDTNKPLYKAQVQVVKLVNQSGRAATYIMETASGKRLMLRTFQADQLLLMPGDVGIIHFRGKTIERFERGVESFPQS